MIWKPIVHTNHRESFPSEPLRPSGVAEDVWPQAARRSFLQQGLGSQPAAAGRGSIEADEVGLQGLEEDTDPW